MSFLSTERLDELIMLKGPISPEGDVYLPEVFGSEYIEYTKKRIAREQRLEEYEKQLRRENNTPPQPSAFLSYSHYDKKWAHGLSLYFDLIKADLYVDLRDDTLPREVGGETARSLRDRIAKRDKFILLATDRTKDSAWVPWELGLADGLKGHSNVVIFPLSNFTDFDGQEYFADYSHVELSGMNMHTVVDPKNGTRQEFSHWLHDIKWTKSPNKQSTRMAWWNK